MPNPPSASHRTFILGTIVVLALLVVVVIAQFGGFGGLRGALSDATFVRNGLTENFRFGPLASAENADLPAGTHGVFTCPASIGTNERWLSPVDFSSVSGLKVYEYTADFAAEKNPTNSTWPGERYGYAGSQLPTLASFKASRTYYVQASQQFAFSCSGPATVGSSSSSSSSSTPVSSSSSSSVSSSSSSSAAPIQADISVTALGIPASVAPGATITMSYQMTNGGPGSPASVLLSFIPSSVFTFTNSGGCTQQGNSYQCGSFLVVSGNTIGRQVNLTVSPSAPCGSSQNILGTVSLSSGTDPVPGNNSVNGTVSIACSSSSSSLSSSSSSVPPSSSSSSSSTTEAGLIGYWPMDEGTGTVSQDETAGDHDVVFTNGATWGAPLATGVGSAVSLNGVDQYVNIGALALFNFQYSNDFSLGAYVRPSATSPQDGIIVGKVENRGFAFPGWAMTYTSDQRFGFKMSGSSFLTPVGLEVKTTATFAPNTTHHVVVSYNGTNATNAGTSNAVKIYVDGTEYSVARGNLTVSLDNLRSPGGISSIANNGEAQIGMGDGAISPFAGLIDHVKIYDRVIVPTN